MTTKKVSILKAWLLGLLLLGSVAVRAQTTPLSDVDALRYIASQPDLIAAFGADAAKGRSHYETWGLKEGRKITFEPLNYTASHPDLMSAFGIDETKAVTHYIQWGFKEGRRITFNPLNYIASQPDLISAFGADAAKGARHYIQWGYAEKRQITFDPARYMASHPDLIQAFAGDETKGATHYIQWGYKEKRQITFSDLDALQYVASFADLIQSIGSDVITAIRHYVTSGYNAGRRITFDALAYIASHGDLITAFGTDALAGVKHYINWGFREGRQVVFDALGYLSRHTDLQQAFGSDTVAATKHYINWGYREGRSFLVTVSATASAGGSVSSTGGLVQLGQISVFTFTPERGYILKSVTGCAGRLTGTTFTTSPATGPCTLVGQFERPDKPVAISDTEIYSVPRWIMLDGTRSIDPNDKPLKCTWKFLQNPDGFAGPSFQSSDGCMIAFNPNTRDGGYALGTYRVALTVTNGVDTSAPLDIRLEVCCSGFANVAEAAAHAKKLPVYSIGQAKTLFASYKPDNDPDYFKFAAFYGFSPYHLDYLRGVSAGTTITKIVTESGSQFVGIPPNGGAAITGYSMPIDGVIQTDLELSQVSYPRDYAASSARSANVEDPFCASSSTKNTYLARDLGDYPLPDIKVSPLPAAMLRLADIKDIWSLQTPNLGQGCVEDMASAVDRMFDRLQKLGVNAVSITPWGWFDARQSQWSVIKAGQKQSDIYPSEWTDENVEWFVTRAKQRGFKVYWVNQIQAAFKTKTDVLLTSDTTATDVQKAFDALDSYILERGRFLQSIGVDGVLLGSWYWANFESYLTTAEFSARTTRLIDKLKQNFKGKVIYQVAGPDALTSDLVSRVDFIGYPTNANYDRDSLNNFSIADLKRQFSQQYQRFADKTGGKPVFFQASIQSRRDFYPQQNYFDPFCTGDGRLKCPQEAMRGDYSMQAVFIEASLEFVAAQSAGSIAGVSMNYHMNSNLLPPSNFFNIDATVRGKPAEYIFYKWFTAK